MAGAARNRLYCMLNMSHCADVAVYRLIRDVPGLEFFVTNINFKQCCFCFAMCEWVMAPSHIIYSSALQNEPKFFCWECSVLKVHSEGGVIFMVSCMKPIWSSSLVIGAERKHPWSCYSKLKILSVYYQVLRLGGGKGIIYTLQASPHKSRLFQVEGTAVKKTLVSVIAFFHSSL